MIVISRNWVSGERIPDTTESNPKGNGEELVFEGRMTAETRRLIKLIRMPMDSTLFGKGRRGNLGAEIMLLRMGAFWRNF
jgi:hypothetical protein